MRRECTHGTAESRVRSCMRWGAAALLRLHCKLHRSDRSPALPASSLVPHLSLAKQLYLQKKKKPTVFQSVRLHLRRSSRVAELRRNVRLHGGTIARARDAAAGGCSCAHYPPVFVARQRKGAAARRALATGRASASARTRVLIAWAPVCPLACAPVQNGDPVPGDPRFQYQNQWQTGRCVSCSRRPAQPAACRSTRPIVPPRAPARTRERAETGVCARAGAHKRTRAHPHTQKVHTHARPHAHAKSSHARTTHRLTRTRTRVRTNTGMMNAPCADPVCFCAGLVFCVPVCVCAGIYLCAPSTRICIGQRHKHAQTQTHTHTHTHTHSICTAVRLVSTCVHTYI